MESFMRESDAFSWYMEDDPILRSTVVAVVWLDRSPVWEDFVARVDRLSRLIPMFRQRVLEAPGRVVPPRWSVDPDFDLTWHVRRIDTPAPHTSEAVVDFARREAMSAFDRARPLWHLTSVEHLEGDRAAVVMKLHHSLTDGVGGMELALLLFDGERTPERPAPPPDAPAGERLDTAGLLREYAAWSLARSARLAGAGMMSAPGGALGALRHPLAGVRGVLETAGSVGRTVAPLFHTLSPIMTGRGLGRHLDVLDVGLDELKAASAAAGGSVNDGFLAAVTGGLRVYHERHEAPVRDLRITMPISIRTPADPVGGNRITLMRFVLPVADPDPARRIVEIERRCRAVRDERSLAHTNAIAGGLNLLPTAAVGGMLKHVDFLASDVPGFADPVYLAGAEVERYTAFGPTIGASVNLTLLSYRGRCSVGVNMDTAAIPDPDVFMDSLGDGFDEVLALGARTRSAGRARPKAPAAAGRQATERAGSG